MSKFQSFIIIAAALVLASGCSQVVEFPKRIWGSSTKDLENGRATAIQKTYHCTVEECFDTVLTLTQRPKEEYGEEKVPLAPSIQNPVQLAPVSPLDPAQNAITPGTDQTVYLDLYIKNRKKNMIVVMGVPNCVNTTEVGIFFTPLDQGNIKIELSSLSTKAKRNASEVVFKELGKHYPEIE